MINHDFIVSAQRLYGAAVITISITAAIRLAKRDCKDIKLWKQTHPLCKEES